MFRPLDPTKAWRFQVNVALDSDFPATNLFSFTIPRTLTGTIQTNLGGFEVHIGYNNADWLNVVRWRFKSEDIVPLCVCPNVRFVFSRWRGNPFAS
jgi:hypothetical protein